MWLGGLPFTHEVHEFSGTADPKVRADLRAACLIGFAFRPARRAGPTLRHQPLSVEPIHRFVEIVVAAITAAGEQTLDFPPHGAVVRQKIEGPRERVVDQALANENLRRSDRVNPAITHGAHLQFQTIEPAAPFHQHPGFFGVPEWFAVRGPHDMRAELQRPRRIEPRAGARIKPRSLHDLRRHQPARALRVFLLRWSLPVVRPASLGLLPPEQHRAGKQIHAPVMRRLVATFFLVELGDVAQQAGQN